MTAFAHRTKQRTKRIFNLVSTHATDQGQTTRNLCGVEFLTQFKNEINGGRWSDLATEGIANTAQEFDVCAIKLTSAFTDPQHVC